MPPSFNPNVRHRRSIRLKTFDYSKPGTFFITLCVKGRMNLFGKIVHGTMVLNDAGEMMTSWYFELEQKFGTATV